MDTWIILKLLHFKHTLDNDLNIWHIIQVASLTKRRGERDKGRCIVPCWSLADYWVLSPFKCTMSHSFTWILCSFLAQKVGGQEVVSPGFAACSVFWPCNWKMDNKLNLGKPLSSSEPELSNLLYRENTLAYPLGWGIMGIKGIPGALSTLVEMHHIMRDYFTYRSTFAYVRTEFTYRDILAYVRRNYFL